MGLKAHPKNKKPQGGFAVFVLGGTALLKMPRHQPPVPAQPYSHPGGRAFYRKAVGEGTSDREMRIPQAP
jgi:hypothetical protein